MPVAVFCLFYDAVSTHHKTSMVGILVTDGLEQTWKQRSATYAIITRGLSQDNRYLAFDSSRITRLECRRYTCS